MERDERVEKFRRIYEEGKDRNNSLSLYSEYVSNSFPGLDLREFISWLVKEKGKIKVLDVGCGGAGFLSELKQLFGESVFVVGLELVDFQAQVDEKVLGDAYYMVWPRKCDLIVSFRALHEIGESEEIMGKALEALKQGGMAILSFRVQDFLEGKLQYLGIMNGEDAKFLKGIGEKGSFEKADVESIESYKEQAGLKFLNGVTLILEKKG